MNNYLAHYGVLGMKWGQRRVRKLNEKAAQQKRYAEDYNPRNVIGKASNTERAKLNYKYKKMRDKAKKYSAKAKKIETKHRDRGGKAYDYTKNQSTLQAVGKSLVLGTYGTLKYNEARAKGESRGSAFVNGFGANMLDSLTYGGASIVAPRYRQQKAKMARQNS